MAAEIETLMPAATVAAVQPTDSGSDGPGLAAIQPRGDARIGEVVDTVDWLDPIVGARVLFDLSPRWDLALAAD